MHKNYLIIVIDVHKASAFTVCLMLDNLDAIRI